MLAVCGSCLRAIEGPAEPQVTFEPFEPAPQEFFRAEDKFAHPKAIIAPKFLWPFEIRRHVGAYLPAEAVILVRLDGHGHAKTLRALSAPHRAFARSAIFALEKAQWDCSWEAWFYYKAVFTLEE
jgi:hypothetical protein